MSSNKKVGLGWGAQTSGIVKERSTDFRGRTNRRKRPGRPRFQRGNKSSQQRFPTHGGKVQIAMMRREEGELAEWKTKAKASANQSQLRSVRRASISRDRFALNGEPPSQSVFRIPEDAPHYLARARRQPAPFANHLTKTTLAIVTMRFNRPRRKRDSTHCRAILQKSA